MTLKRSQTIQIKFIGFVKRTKTYKLLFGAKCKCSRWTKSGPLFFAPIFFWLQVLFDLIVQSPLNKKKTLHHFRHHIDQSRSGRPHSPQPGMQSTSRQETKTKQTQQTQTKTAKNGECSGLSQLCTNIQIKKPHTAATRY